MFEIRTDRSHAGSGNRSSVSSPGSLCWRWSPRPGAVAAFGVLPPRISRCRPPAAVRRFVFRQNARSLPAAPRPAFVLRPIEVLGAALELL